MKMLANLNSNFFHYPLKKEEKLKNSYLFIL